MKYIIQQVSGRQFAQILRLHLLSSRPARGWLMSLGESSKPAEVLWKRIPFCRYVCPSQPIATDNDTA
jgi:hypothetical protein